MSPDDTADSVYTVAFDETGRFLMVWNPKRDGWEMPGGHVKRGETRAQAAVREYAEESGCAVEIVAERDLGHCGVCSGVLRGRVPGSPEMKCQMFESLPERLAFDREEYLDTVPWARSFVHVRE